MSRHKAKSHRTGSYLNLNCVSPMHASIEIKTKTNSCIYGYWDIENKFNRYLRVTYPFSASNAFVYFDDKWLPTMVWLSLHGRGGSVRPSCHVCCFLVTVGHIFFADMIFSRIAENSISRTWYFRGLGPKNVLYFLSKSIINIVFVDMIFSRFC